MSDTKVLLTGLAFGEAPRWRDGRLYFSDFYMHEVVAVTPEGERETIVKVPNQPSGLGWMPDGTMLIVSMTDRKLMKFDGSTLSVFADLGNLATFHCNDMVVDARGRAYIGNFGANLTPGADIVPANLMRVDPDGSTHLAASDLIFPNGSVITPDGKTLVVAETFGKRLSAWDIAEDGSLSNRRIWAELGVHYPDGICLDAEGAIWVTDPRNNVTIRVLEGGEITNTVSTGDNGSYACMLGGEDRKTLFICTCIDSKPSVAEKRAGRIETIQVDVAGAGLP